jgi:hypothetical protein
MATFPTDRIDERILKRTNPLETYLIHTLADKEFPLLYGSLPFAARYDEDPRSLWESFVADDPTAAHIYVSRMLTNLRSGRSAGSSPEAKRLFGTTFQARIDETIANLELAQETLIFNPSVIRLPDLETNGKITVLYPEDHEALVETVGPDRVLYAISDEYRKREADKITTHLSRVERAN